MAESHVISALKDKRAELSGEVLRAESRIDKLRLDIAAIDRALGIFDPTVIPRSIKPVIRRPRLTRIKQGAWTLAVLDILRRSDRSLAASEIAALVAKQFGEPYESPVDRNNMDQRIRQLLRKPRLGVVSEWNGSLTVWRIADVV